jgi:hypothetical protein
VLAEIAAANAAFQVIKGALSNGRELYDVADQATKYFDNKSAIAKKANKNGSKDDMACFMEMEKIKAQEEWLKDFMVYAGRADMYKDWLQFQSDRKKHRAQAAAAAKRKKAQNIAILMTALLWGAGGLVLLPITMYTCFKIFGVI